jgi:predicted RNase H-like HicB family nuclease
MAMLIRYELVIYWSDEDGYFVVEVPELPGCFADGKTYAEAVSNVEVVIREWIETATELGRDIPQPKGRLIYA